MCKLPLRDMVFGMFWVKGVVRASKKLKNKGNLAFEQIFLNISLAQLGEKVTQ